MLKQTSGLIEVAVDAPLLNPLTYLPHPEFAVQRGSIVNVQLGKRMTKGYVLQTNVTSNIPENIELKQIVSQDLEWPQLPDHFMKWLEWISEYYIHPIGQVINLSFPPLHRATQQRKSKRPPVIPDLQTLAKPELSTEQKQCLDNIEVKNQFAVHLVHGVTGSGKTEVYLNLFERCLQQNKKGLFLLPEISLTPQLVNRFVQRFGNQVAVLHSQLTDRERTNQWWEMIEGEKKILIGARSALFCPISDLGLIVVDEEHESSFKQDEKLKYHGRDCAVMLARFSQCPVILGSATPSLETWKNAQEGKYQLHSLKSRIEDRPLPQIEIIDLRAEKTNETRPSNLPHWLSHKLYEKMQTVLANNEQVALLLNRRGVANLVCCQSCGFTNECPNCDISLTLHAQSHLVCHYCDYHENFKVQCPSCKVGQLTALGLGTEKIENDLKTLFPEKILARADRDEIQNRLEMENLVNDMEEGKIDILIGTQMIAKGLDFPKLNLVGLVLADIGFNLPDFRSTEKNFQLITQMSGRAGRHITDPERTGEVVVQAFNIQHDALTFAQAHDYIGFANHELQIRDPLKYPPFQKMVSFRVQSSELDLAHLCLKHLKNRSEALKIKFQNQYSEIQILGPAPAPLTKLRNQFRFHMIIKHGQAKVLNHFARQVLGDQKWVPSKTKIILDVDPMSLL